MNKLILIGALLALSACGHSTSHNSSGSGSPPVTGSMANAHKTTTVAQCATGLPATSLFGAWHTTFAAPNVNFLMTFSFDQNGYASVQNECQFSDGVTMTSQLSTPYYESTDTLQFPASVEHHEENGGITCDVSVKPGVLQYTFEGSCLVFTDDKGEKLYLTH